MSVTDVWVDPIEIDENLPPDVLNEQTMSYYFGESIARLIDLGDGAYRTSANRTVHGSVDVDPPGFAPLMEWRIDNEPVLLGATAALRFGTNDIGNHAVGVGPTGTSEVIEIETYSVTITNLTGEDFIPDGESVIFIAETDPPGYEAEITWLSSTKYGVAIPVLGEGPVFVARFDDTWGVDADGDPFQWLSVKADNTAFGQDGDCDELDCESITRWINAAVCLPNCNPTCIGAVPGTYCMRINNLCCPTPGGCDIEISLWDDDVVINDKLSCRRKHVPHADKPYGTNILCFRIACDFQDNACGVCDGAARCNTDDGGTGSQLFWEVAIVNADGTIGSVICETPFTELLHIDCDCN